MSALSVKLNVAYLERKSPSRHDGTKFVNVVRGFDEYVRGMLEGCCETLTWTLLYSPAPSRLMIQVVGASSDVRARSSISRTCKFAVPCCLPMPSHFWSEWRRFSMISANKAV